jgi:hypothetical protein
MPTVSGLVTVLERICSGKVLAVLYIGVSPFAEIAVGLPMPVTSAPVALVKSFSMDMTVSCVGKELNQLRPDDLLAKHNAP